MVENMTFVSPKSLRKEIPLTYEFLSQVSAWRQNVVEILQGKDERLLLIVGPCSIHDVVTAHEYAERLKIVAEEVADVFFIIMRAYFEKPRTLFGWKGLLYDPHIDNTSDMLLGVRKSRALLSSLTQLGLPAATEFLDPLASYYLSDFITWGSIGARTVQSQIHRQLASSLAMPIGFKNRTDGNIECAVQAILAAKQPHAFLGIDENGTISQQYGSGNLFPHLVLRGGETEPNYDPDSIRYAEMQLASAALPSRLIVDCSHDNCKKSFQRQCEVFSSVIQQVERGATAIRGLMLESFLLDSDASTRDASRISITDPCLGWDTTRELILQSAEKLRSHTLSCREKPCSVT